MRTVHTPILSLLLTLSLLTGCSFTLLPASGIDNISSATSSGLVESQPAPVEQDAFFYNARLGRGVNAEARGFSFAYWEFASSFGVYDKAKRSWQPELLRALIQE